MITVKKEKDIAELRVSGRILGAVLRELARMAVPGISLSKLDERARGLIREAGARPAFLGYRPEGEGSPFPGAICASLNDTVVHGIPGKQKLKEGDVLSIDLGVDYRGYFTDAAVTVGVGKISETARRLITTAQDALREAIALCRPGNQLGDIGNAISETARRAGFSVVRGLTGHGVGFELHEDPTVFNYGKRGQGIELKKGYVLALEPMFSAGSGDIIQKDDESFATKDHSIAAHAEHTVLITDGDPEVLTL